MQSADRPLQTTSPLERERVRFASNTTDTRRRILDRLSHHKVPGIGIAIIEDNEILWADGFGVTAVTNAMPVTSETLFPIWLCQQTGRRRRGVVPGGSWALGSRRGRESVFEILDYSP